MSDVPSLDVFRQRGREGGWTALVRSLAPNEPRDITDIVRTKKSATTQVYQAARAQGRRVSLRTVEGRVWACWLVDES